MNTGRGYGFDRELIKAYVNSLTKRIYWSNVCVFKRSVIYTLIWQYAK